MTDMTDPAQTWVEQYRQRHGDWAYIVTDSGDYTYRGRSPSRAAGLCPSRAAGLCPWGIDKVSVAYQGTSEGSVVCAYHEGGYPRDCTYRAPECVYPTLDAARAALLAKIDRLLSEQRAQIAEIQSRVDTALVWRRTAETTAANPT